MRERAERIGVNFNSTPVELRQIVDENSSPGAVTRARVSIHSFQNSRSQTIRRAEIREQSLRAEFNRRCDPPEPGQIRVAQCLIGFDDSDGDNGDPGGEPEHDPPGPAPEKDEDRRYCQD